MHFFGQYENMIDLSDCFHYNCKLTNIHFYILVSTRRRHEDNPGRHFLDRYLIILKKRAVPVSRHADYKKWLRYFRDFRDKYTLPNSRSDQVRMFIQKLRDKRQTAEQQKQAAHAISL